MIIGLFDKIHIVPLNCIFSAGCVGGVSLALANSVWSAWTVCIILLPKLHVIAHQAFYYSLCNKDDSIPISKF